MMPLIEILVPKAGQEIRWNDGVFSAKENYSAEGKSSCTSGENAIRESRFQPKQTLRS